VYGGDAYFELGRLQLNGFVLGSETPDRSGRNQARRMGAAWQDDELVASAEYNLVQSNFNPEVGFLRRGNIAHYSGDVAWRPRLERSETIRNLDFGVSAVYYEGADSGAIETRIQDVNAGILFNNNGSVNLNVNQTFDRLTRNARILSATLAPGDYDYLSYTASFNTNQSRKVAGNGSYTWGEFWNGTRRSFSGGLGFTPNYHLSVDTTYSRNLVELPTGPITTDLVGMRLVYTFTGRATLNTFVQYNTDTRQVSSNIRFNFIHRPLSDLYLVYNDRRDTALGQIMDRSFTIKLTNLFDF
jgi:hypothetical protein